MIRSRVTTPRNVGLKRKERRAKILEILVHVFYLLERLYTGISCHEYPNIILILHSKVCCCCCKSP